MSRRTFGTKDQVRLDTAADHYEFLGYLARDNGTTKLVWEHNDEQGAWAQEGQIHFNMPQPVPLRARLNHTAGFGSIVSRINCNDFIENVAEHDHFVSYGPQNEPRITAAIPVACIDYFNRGLAL